jgi:gamma-glutamyltranspeptidase/glutathione hydrolase
MVSPGSVEATQAGVRILEKGGNAVDAAVAAAFVLGVADPGGSGLGGMTYILISLADGRAMAIDGSTTSPIAADPSAFLAIRKSGDSFGAKVVAVPVTLAALNRALSRYGTMDLSTVLAPAIEIAEQGYRRSPNSVAWAKGYLDEIRASHYLRFVVLEDGEYLGSAGSVVCRPDLARTLRHIADEGVDSFYRGDIAAQMVAHLRSLGGYIRRSDLAFVQVPERPALRSQYRGAEILAFPSPGAGPEVVEALNILQTFPTEILAVHTVERLHLLVEAYRIAQIDHQDFAQRSEQQVMGTPSYLGEGHARTRAALITPGRAILETDLGVKPSVSILGEHTTQVSVTDSVGNAVSLTQTLCRQYGVKVATPGLGFPYNSCLEFLDFENPESPLFLSARRRYPSGMAPTIFRHNWRLVVLGSAGSDRIAPSVTEVISNIIDRNMDLKAAVAAPRVLWNSAHDPPRVCLEIADPVTTNDADRLQSFGFKHMYRFEYPPNPLSDSAFFGGVNAVLYDSATGIFSGVGDPRRSGFAEGPRAVVDPKERP